MEIEGTTFGTITIDGKTYEHDVIIRLSGEVVKRKKKLSKKYYGTSHVLSKDEAKFVFERGCEQLILGSGQIGNVHLSPEAEAYFAKKGCKVLLQPTPEAIQCVQQVARKEDRAFSRDLLKRTGARRDGALSRYGNDRQSLNCGSTRMGGLGATTAALRRHRPWACHHPQARAHDGRRRDSKQRAGQGVGVYGAPAGRHASLTRGKPQIAELRCNISGKMWPIPYGLAANRL